MATPIDFYFDFSSPYGYLASTCIDGLAAKYGRSVSWRPVLLGAVFKVTGAQPLPSIPLKGDYSRRDISRSARFYGIPLNFPQTFPISTLAPARAFYWVSDRDEARARRLAQALYRAYFVDSRDISNPELTAEVAAAVAINQEELAAALADPTVKDRLRRENDAALARGVFGSPYFIVDDEPFWGMDRVSQLERWLATGGF